MYCVLRLISGAEKCAVSEATLLLEVEKHVTWVVRGIRVFGGFKGYIILMSVGVRKQGLLGENAHLQHHISRLLWYMHQQCPKLFTK